MLLFEFRKFAFQFFPAGDHLALPRNIRAQTASPRTQFKVSLRFFPPDFAHRSRHAHLTFERMPWKSQRRARVRGEFASLAAQVVREKNKTARVDLFQ